MVGKSFNFLQKFLYLVIYLNIGKLKKYFLAFHTFGLNNDRNNHRYDLMEF